MFQLNVRRLVLALALAAVAGSTMLPSASPASAASPLSTDNHRQKYEQTQPPSKPSFNPPATPTTFPALLAVKHVSTQFVAPGLGALYTFKIENTGLSATDPIVVESGYWWSTSLGTPIHGHPNPQMALPSMAPGHVHHYSFTCVEGDQTVCHGAGVRASAPKRRHPRQ